MQRNIRRKKRKGLFGRKISQHYSEIAYYSRKRWIFQDFFGIIILD